MNNISGAWVYIFFTSENYNRCKIGTTRPNPLIRFRTQRTADPFLGIRSAYFIPDHLGIAGKIETAIHKELKGYRIETHEETKSEWFTITCEEAEMFIEGYLEEWSNQKLSISHGIHHGLITKVYESDLDEINFANYVVKNQNGPFN